MHGTMPNLNRKGRKRKSGRRTACGDLARAKVDYRAMAAEWPHRKTLPAFARASELAESEIGRLCLLKRITAQMCDAGRHFASIVEAHRSVISAPRASNGTGLGFECNPLKCVPRDCDCRKRMERYRDATHALQLEGQAVYNTTYRVAVSDETCQPHERDDLRKGLSKLIRHFGI